MATNRFSEVLHHLVDGGLDGRTHSLTEISRGTGLPVPYLSKAMKGDIADPGVARVVALARYFGLDEGQLARVIVDPSLPLPTRVFAVRFNLNDEQAAEIANRVRPLLREERVTAGLAVVEAALARQDVALPPLDYETMLDISAAIDHIWRWADKDPSRAFVERYNALSLAATALKDAGLLYASDALLADFAAQYPEIDFTASAVQIVEALGEMGERWKEALQVRFGGHGEPYRWPADLMRPSGTEDHAVPTPE